MSRSRSTMARPAFDEVVAPLAASALPVVGARSRQQLGDRLEARGVAHEPRGFREPLRQRLGRARDRLAQVVDRHPARAPREGEVDACRAPRARRRGRRRRGRGRLAIPGHLDQAVKRRERERRPTRPAPARAGTAGRPASPAAAASMARPRIDARASAVEALADAQAPDRRTRVFGRAGVRSGFSTSGSARSMTSRACRRSASGRSASRMKALSVSRTRVLSGLSRYAPSRPTAAAAHRGVGRVRLQLFRAELGAAPIGRGLEHLQDGRPGRGRRPRGRRRRSGGAPRGRRSRSAAPRPSPGRRRRRRTDRRGGASISAAADLRIATSLLLRVGVASFRRPRPARC